MFRTFDIEAEQKVVELTGNFSDWRTRLTRAASLDEVGSSRGDAEHENHPGLFTDRLDAQGVERERQHGCRCKQESVHETLLDRDQYPLPTGNLRSRG